MIAALFLAAQLISIPSPAGPGSAEPSLFAARDALILSWTEGPELRFARYDGKKWSEPRTVVHRDDLFINWADFGTVIEDSNGVLFAHWLQKSGSGYAYDIWMSSSSDRGRTWSAPFLLNRDGRKNEHGFVSLVPLAGGGVAAAWLDGRNMPEGKEEGEMSLRYATIDARGKIAAETELDGRTCECCTTGMAMTSNGPLIVYRDRSADEVRDIAYVRPGSKPHIVHDDGWKITGCPVNGPQVDAKGKSAAVAWFTAANGAQHVYAAFSRDGGAAFGSPIAVDGGHPSGRVDIALLDRDRAFVTWLEGDEIRGREVTRDGHAGAPMKIGDSGSSRAAGFARIAVFARDVYVAWTEPAPGGKRVRVARIH